MSEITFLEGDCLDVLKTLPANSVQCCITSPPYFGLRDYGTAKWEGGDPECDHNPQKPDGGDRENRALPLGRDAMYKDICGKCGAVRIDDQIGLERTPSCGLHGKVRIRRDLSKDQLEYVVARLRDAGLLYVPGDDNEHKE